MKLTLVNQFYPPDVSPTSQLAESLALHRSVRGDRVTVIAGTASYAEAHEEGETAGRGSVLQRRVGSPGLGRGRISHRVTEGLAFLARASLELARLPAQDAVVCMTSPPFLVLAGLMHRIRHRDSRLILWNMDCYPEAAVCAGVLSGEGTLARSLRMLNCLAYRRLSGLVCLDGAMQRLLGSRYGELAPGGVIRVIPNWERVNGAGPIETPPPAALAAPGKFRILYSGNAGIGHDLKTLLSAAGELRNDPVAFLVVGGGSGWEWLARRVEELGLENVVLHPYLRPVDRDAVLGASHCALVTLKESALGIMSPSKIHSYLKFGLPLLYVGPEGGNVDEAIRRFDCGLSLRNGDGRGLADAVRRLRRQPEERAVLARRAKRAFRIGYSERVALPRFDEFLDEVCAAPRRGESPARGGGEWQTGMASLRPAFARPSRGSVAEMR